MRVSRRQIHLRPTILVLFYVTFGRDPVLPEDILFNLPGATVPQHEKEYTSHLRTKLQQAYGRVRAHMQQEYSRRKDSYDQKIEGKPYDVGDLVWLHSPAVPRGRSRKFHKPWVGPFKIVKVVSKLVYRIQYSNKPRKRFVVHFN